MYAIRELSPSGFKVTAKILPFQPRDDGFSPAANAPANLTGRVNHIVYLGERALYELAVGTTTLFMQITNPQEQGLGEPGQTIGLTLHHKGLVALPS